MKVRGKATTKGTSTPKKTVKFSRSHPLNQYFRSTKTGTSSSTRDPKLQSPQSSSHELPFLPSPYKAEKEKEKAEPSSERERADLEALHAFDLCSEFGPCIGMSRAERWERAQRFGLSPPDNVLQLLREHLNDTRYTNWCSYLAFLNVCMDFSLCLRIIILRIINFLDCSIWQNYQL